MVHRVGVANGHLPQILVNQDMFKGVLTTYQAKHQQRRENLKSKKYAVSQNASMTKKGL